MRTTTNVMLVVNLCVKTALSGSRSYTLPTNIALPVMKRSFQMLVKESVLFFVLLIAILFLGVYFGISTAKVQIDKEITHRNITKNHLDFLIRNSGVCLKDTCNH